MTESRHVIQEAGDARLVIDLDHGGRFSSFTLGGLELLVGSGPSSIEWGWYVMAPFAGRLRRGELRYGGKLHKLPTNLPPHAIHGTVLDRRWHAVDAHTFGVSFGDTWPWPGEVEHQVRLSPGRLDLRLEVRTFGESMPASCGWHPWFRRTLENGAPANLTFTAQSIEVRESDGIPRGRRSPVPPGPWDDCFTEVTWPATISWPGAVVLEISSSCNHLVVFDERDYAVCVEPQTAPPDALNWAPTVVTKANPLVVTSTWTWRRPAIASECGQGRADG